MALVWGEKLYGQVNRVPGTSYISTKFGHVWFLPLVPTGSYLVEEGSEDLEGGFSGERIPLNLKSVVVGYLRGWSAATAVVTTLVWALVCSRELAAGRGEGVSAVVYTLVFGILLGLVWDVVATPTRRFIVSEGLLLGLTIVWWLLFAADRAARPDGAKDPTVQIWPVYLIVNGSLLLYSLTRLATHGHKALVERMPMNDFRNVGR